MLSEHRSMVYVHDTMCHIDVILGIEKKNKLFNLQEFLL